MAQISITVTPDVAEGSFSNIDLSQYNDLEVHVAVTNNSDQPVNLKWLREIPAGCPAGWKTQVCDNNICYHSSVSSNIDPNIQLDAPFVLDAGETYDNFLLHILPGVNGTAGCCQPTIYFSTVENPDVILATVTYNISINTPDCGFTSSTGEVSGAAALKVYPNPTTGLFTVSDSPLVKKVVVYNLLGKQVKAFQHVAGDQHDLSQLPDGLYLASLQNAKGEVLKTVRLNKQAYRP